MNKHTFSLLLFINFAFLFFNFYLAKAQNVGIGTNSPTSSALLELKSTNSGFLPPRMTYTQRNTIQNPVQGLIIYCTDCGTNGGEPQYYNGSSWFNINGNPASTNFMNLPSVTIGTQIWSTKNLDLLTYRNGDPIPQVTNASEWANLTTGAWCWYNNDSVNYSKYGKLYNWYAVNDPRGLAPQGWHVPTHSDWNKLVKSLDPAADTACIGCYQSIIVGGVIKNTSGWLNNGNGSNSSGFGAMPGGSRRFNGNFDFLAGYNAFWWSSTEQSSSTAWIRYLTSSGNTIFNDHVNKVIGYSVRVVRD
jgi:uncharacterized protein (TIGR02145 family)